MTQAAKDLIYGRKIMPIVLERTKNPFGDTAEIFGDGGLTMNISVCPPGQGLAVTRDRWIPLVAIDHREVLLEPRRARELVAARDDEPRAAQLEASDGGIAARVQLAYEADHEWVVSTHGGEHRLRTLLQVVERSPPGTSWQIAACAWPRRCRGRDLGIHLCA